MGELEKLKEELKSKADPEKAKGAERFFKTGKGQYGEGDIFLGVGGTKQREIAKKYWRSITLNDVQDLLNSKIHTYRQTGLRILCEKYKHSKKDKLEKRQIFEFYMKNLRNINNWDLVDCSAPHIVGDFALKEGSSAIRLLAKSSNIWEKRIAIISTYAFIKMGNFGETLFIADSLINDEHDLIHKAVGWMLREVGKRNISVLELFLLTRYKKMPRTMLRYAIEKFREKKRKKYLRGEI